MNKIASLHLASLHLAWLCLAWLCLAWLCLALLWLVLLCLELLGFAVLGFYENKKQYSFTGGYDYNTLKIFNQSASCIMYKKFMENYIVIAQRSCVGQPVDFCVDFCRAAGQRFLSFGWSTHALFVAQRSQDFCCVFFVAGFLSRFFVAGFLSRFFVAGFLYFFALSVSRLWAELAECSFCHITPVGESFACSWASHAGTIFPAMEWEVGWVISWLAELTALDGMADLDELTELYSLAAWGGMAEVAGLSWLVELAAIDGMADLDGLEKMNGLAAWGGIA